MTLRQQQARLAAVALGEAAPESFEAQVRSDARASSTQRLEVYRQLVESVHLECLDGQFPVCAAVLGTRYWHQLIRELWARPGSSEADLGEFGSDFPALLASAVVSRRELADFSYLPELAALEWQVALATNATGETFDWTAFAALDAEEQARAELHCSRALVPIALAAPVDEIWRRHRAADSDHEIPASNAERCLIHPHGRFEVTVSPLSQEDAQLLAVLQVEKSLDAIGGRIGADALESVVARLHAWIRTGWITEFRAG